MNKIVIAIIIACFSNGVFAACPTPIGMAGIFSGRATYTELPNGVVSDIAEKLFVVKLNGAGNAVQSGIATSLKYIEASPGNLTVQIKSTPSILSYTYDSSSCSVTISDPTNGSGTLYMVVANGGNTLFGVKRDLTYVGVERYEFTRQ